MVRIRRLLSLAIWCFVQGRFRSTRRGAGLDTVVSVNVYLKNMDDFKMVNEVYTAVFGDNKPARVTVGVSELPKNALVEISCVAVLRK